MRSLGLQLAFLGLHIMMTKTESPVMLFKCGADHGDRAALPTGCAYSEAGDASLAGELDMGKELIVLSAPPDTVLIVQMRVFNTNPFP